MFESAHFSKGCYCPPPRYPNPSPCVIRKYFLHKLIYIVICWQFHSYVFVQVSFAMLMSVDLVLDK